MTVEIIRRYTWNNTDYCHVRFSDGTVVELAADIGVYVTDDDWIAYALAWIASRPVEPDPMEQLLRCCPEDMLVAEVLRRHLNITVEGGVV